MSNPKLKCVDISAVSFTLLQNTEAEIILMTSMFLCEAGLSHYFRFKRYQVWCSTTNTFRCCCVWYFQCDLVLFAATGVEHYAGVLGENGIFQQRQLARQFKQTIVCQLCLHFTACCPILVVLIEPAKLTFWVSTNRATGQGDIFSSSNVHRDGAYCWFVVFGCQDRDRKLTCSLT